MGTIIQALERYLFQTLSVRATIRPWKGEKKLPFFLLDSYEFYEVSFWEKTFLLMIAKEGVESTPAKVRKQWEHVQKKWTGLCIYVQATISAYNRKRMIEQRVPFIVPDNQMYLPDLGIDLREHFRKIQIAKKTFSPSTQAVVIYALIHGTSDRYIPSELARELGYTFMTLTRAFDELEAAKIGEVHRKGRERWWLFKGSCRELWEQAKPWMRNPIKNRIWIKRKKLVVQSGLSALAYFSLLNPPTIPVFAISVAEWKRSSYEVLPMPEDAAFEVEIWHYDPNLFAKKGVVDPFSLYLSLKETEDERIEAALEDMMEEIKW